MNNKGLVGQYMILIVMGIVMFCLMVLYWTYSLVAPPLTYAIDLGTSTLQQGVSGDGNLSFAVNSTFVPVNESLDNLRWLSYSLMIIAFLAFIMICSFVRTYPFLLPFWLLIVFILAFLAIYLGNGYQNVAISGNVIGEQYQSWSANDYFMRYLPHIIVVFGLLGGFVLLVLVSRDNTAEVVI